MADLVVPALGESITEAVIGKWLVRVGQHVDADEPVVDLETDKITVQLPAPAGGALSEQRFAEGDTVRVGDIVGLIDTAGKVKPKNDKAGAKAKPAKGKGSEPAKGKAAKPNDADAAKAAEPSEATEPAKTAKAAERPSSDGDRRAAKGAEPASEIPERDALGRVLSPAQRRALREGKDGAPEIARSPSPSPSPAAPPATSAEREELVPMSPLRKRIAERLVQAQHSSASLTTFNEVDMGAIMALRKQYKQEFLDTHGVKLGFMSFAIKATVAALKLYPGLNAEVRGDAIVYKKHYDLGIAVGTPKGLVVPVLRGCDQLGFAEVESGINELAARARDNKLVLDDLVGGTFSVTNGGIYGSMMSTPLLNYPQTGILGMHNIVERPMAVDGKVEIRPVMYLAVTYDHRVVDGAEAVQFLVAIKERMERPDRLLFGV